MHHPLDVQCPAGRMRIYRSLLKRVLLPSAGREGDGLVTCLVCWNQCVGHRIMLWAEAFLPWTTWLCSILGRDTLCPRGYGPSSNSAEEERIPTRAFVKHQRLGPIPWFWMGCCLLLKEEGGVRCRRTMRVLVGDLPSARKG